MKLITIALLLLTSCATSRFIPRDVISCPDYITGFFYTIDLVVISQERGRYVLEVEQMRRIEVSMFEVDVNCKLEYRDNVNYVELK